MTTLRPWTFVLSEYLDLPFILRLSGEPVVSVRSAREAVDCLDRWCPARIVIDTQCFGADQVASYARRFCPDAEIETDDQVISRLLVS